MPHAHPPGDVLPTLLLLLTMLVYTRGWLRLRALDAAKTPVWRASSFLLGLFFVWAAVASPLAGLDHEWLTAHMAQHLLLMTLAAPMIWLGAPVTPFLEGLPRQFVRRILLPVLRRPWMQGLGRSLAHPAVCWFGAAGTLVGWHIPAALVLGLQSQMWHGIEQASFLATGLLFWLPVVQPWPRVFKFSEWAMVLYLFLATVPCDILSGFLVFCDRVVYPVYFLSPRPVGFSALEDQQYAGALMWTCVTVVYLLAGVIFTARLLAPGRAREQALVDAN